MLSKTSIQAMYINRVKDLNSLYREYNKLNDRHINGEDVIDDMNDLCCDIDKLEAQLEILRLILDEDVTKQSGIIPYVLSERTKHDEKLLSIRVFSEQMKRRVWEKQGHKCPLCVKNGIATEYAFEEMQGDHIIPWSKGGRTVEENCQMLCQKCNNDKSDD